MVIDVCFLTVNCLDKEGVLCDADSFCFHRCCVPVHEKYVRDSSWVRNDNFVVIMNV